MLVTVPNQLAYMREPEGGSEEGVLENLLKLEEAILLLHCNRRGIPFSTESQSGRVEYHDGTGGTKLFLEYPVSTITTIKLGADPSNPDDTIDPTDKTELRFNVGSRTIERVDGGVFGKSGVPIYIQVTYDAQAEPEDELNVARAGIMRRVAAMWRQRGLEGIASAGQADVRVQADKDLDALPEWKAAIATCRRLNVV